VPGTSTDSTAPVHIFETNKQFGELYARYLFVIEMTENSSSEPRGRRQGRKPFGFFEGESEAIVKMRLLREKGLGFDRIAAELNKQGVPTRSRKVWHGVVVNRILAARSDRQS
jgi:hypothetical protein